VIQLGTLLMQLHDTEKEGDGECNLRNAKLLRAASPKYQLVLEIAKKSNFFKLAQNEALWALVTNILF